MEEINEDNIEKRAELLLDQYRKKSRLYSDDHNVLLVPLGDDFRFQSQSEADVQFSNYERLFAYMNKRSDMNVHIRFGTLRDYFGLVNQANRKKKTKTLSGDFFTYADKEDHYWSGYYTSRPLLKQQDRLVEQYLRCAEILFSFWKLEERSNQLREDNFFEKPTFSANYVDI